MMHPEATIVPSLIEEVVGEIEIPCDYDRLLHCGPSAATWEMRAACGCGQKAVRLACEGCKDILLQTEEALSCPASCGELFAPARRAFWLIEPLS